MRGHARHSDIKQHHVDNNCNHSGTMGSHSTQPTCVIWELHRVDRVHLKTQHLRSKKRQKQLFKQAKIIRRIIWRHFNVNFFFFYWIRVTLQYKLEPLSLTQSEFEKSLASQFPLKFLHGLTVKADSTILIVFSLTSLHKVQPGTNKLFNDRQTQ